MLAIRFSRVGKRNKAQFKITLQEKTVAPGGRHVEILGSYDPHSKLAILKEDRIKYWLSKGAQASDTVWNLLVSKNVITDKKRAVKMPAKKVEEVAEAKETPKTEEENKAEEVKTEAKNPLRQLADGGEEKQPEPENPLADEKEKPVPEEKSKAKETKKE